MPLLSQVLTEGSGVVIAWTHESQLAQERHELLRRALVDALPLGERVQVVEHLEESSARLVDRADDGAASTRQRLEQRDTLEARRAVQTTVTDRAHMLPETAVFASSQSRGGIKDGGGSYILHYCCLRKQLATSSRTTNTLSDKTSCIIIYQIYCHYTTLLSVWLKSQTPITIHLPRRYH